jgi:predicted AAA+ superfamily ATPase
VEEQLALFPAVVIEGARQVGKSALASLLSEYRTTVTFNLDNPAALDAARFDPIAFVAQGGDNLMVIDEIQRFPELKLALKENIDRNRRPGRFLLMRSSSLFQVKGLTDSLAGRAGRLELFGFSQGETQGQIDDFCTAILDALEAEWRPILSFRSSLARSDYALLVAAGSYPPTFGFNARSRSLWLDAYLKGVANRDLGELNRKYEPARAQALLHSLAGKQSALLNKAKLARSVNVSPTTVTTYLDLFEAVGLYARIPPWTPNLSKRETASPKGLLLDSGLAARLARVTAAQLSNLLLGEALGGFLEAFVCAELLKQQSWSQSDYTIFHYRADTHTEVDLLLELENGDVIGIEVKASTTYRGEDFNGLRRLRDKLGRRFRVGIVLNTAPTGYRYGEKLYGLPVSALWQGF